MNLKKLLIAIVMLFTVLFTASCEKEKLQVGVVTKDLRIAAETLAFEAEELGLPNTQMIKVINKGRVTYHIEAHIKGRDSRFFNLQEKKIAILPNSDNSFFITFAPEERKYYEATLVITPTDADQRIIREIKLKGIGKENGRMYYVIKQEPLGDMLCEDKEWSSDIESTFSVEDMGGEKLKVELYIRKKDRTSFSQEGILCVKYGETISNSDFCSSSKPFFRAKYKAGVEEVHTTFYISKYPSYFGVLAKAYIYTQSAAKDENFATKILIDRNLRPKERD